MTQSYVIASKVFVGKYWKLAQQERRWWKASEIENECAGLNLE